LFCKNASLAATASALFGKSLTLAVAATKGRLFGA
jgi:hypothetical protein